MLPQKNIHGRYDTNELIAFTEAIQRERRNIVIYSRVAESVVEVAWPIKADGTVIVATGLKDWLRARGLFIECFCPLLFDIPHRELNLQAKGVPVVLVSSCGPYDLSGKQSVYKGWTAYVASYEFTAQALEAAVSVIFGQVEGTGKMPVIVR